MADSYNFFEKESLVRGWWEQEKTYQYKPDSTKPVFSIDTPPPTVSGTLHIGHIFSYTHTDIIARYKRMCGNIVLYPFGFDNNGLPTERFVEKKRNITAHSVGRQAFQQACLEETKAAEKGFVDLWKHMGLSIDWDYCYSTISPEVQKISQKSFIELYRKGFVYRKEEPALYCTACRTSVAQAELEDVEKETLFSTILFATEDSQELEVATTRPELLASCVALFYHPEDPRYKKFEGKQARVPFYNFFVPVKADDRVIPDKGTGLVMCCTFGDTLDVYWFKKHNLTYRQSIGFDGRMTTLTGQLAGLTVLEAREKILTLLGENGLIKSQVKIKHMVSVYERSKKEIEYVMLSQWFLKILPYKKELVDAANKIVWHPEHMKQRYVHWVENLQWDWCLSRQRTFGIPFPVWYDADGTVIMADEHTLPVDPQINRPDVIHGEVRPDTDVMDTWNTSSITPLIVQDMVEKAGYNFSLPMGMRPQAHDIIRTWAFYTITKIWMHTGKMPWQDIVISGHVVTSDKQKISKSKDNNPTDPARLFATYPADIIRYWAASSTLGNDAAFSDAQFKNGNKLLVKLWNAGLFVKNHVQDFDIHQDTLGNIEHPMNRWILSKLAKTYASYATYFDAYEYSLALASAEKFFWIDFCDNYLEIIKYQFSGEFIMQSHELPETKRVLAYVYSALLKLFSPVLSHITEYIYRDICKMKHSLHTSGYQLNNLIEDQQDIDSFEIIIDFIDQIRKHKTAAKLSLRAPVNKIAILVTDKLLENNNLEVIKRCIDCINYIGCSSEIVMTNIKPEQLVRIGETGRIEEMALQMPSTTAS